jgi:hypothetical protein
MTVAVQLTVLFTVAFLALVLGVLCAIAWKKNATRQRKALVATGMSVGLFFCVVAMGGGTVLLVLDRGVNSPFLLCKMEIHALRQSIEKFKQTYERWPVPIEATDDITFGPGNQRKLLDVLLGKDAKLNPNGVVFLTVNHDRLEAGQFADPWGLPYFVAFDANSDGTCDIPGLGSFPGASVLIWSEGSGVLMGLKTNSAIVRLTKSPGSTLDK